MHEQKQKIDANRFVGIFGKEHMKYQLHGITIGCDNIHWFMMKSIHYQFKLCQCSKISHPSLHLNTNPSTSINTNHTQKMIMIGRALARSGELLIDLTNALDLYGGGLSATGANIRNCGDCLAQAAASCRFKTAAELVIDELREGKYC